MRKKNTVIHTKWKVFAFSSNSTIYSFLRLFLVGDITTYLCGLHFQKYKKNTHKN